MLLKRRVKVVITLDFNPAKESKQPCSIKNTAEKKGKLNIQFNFILFQSLEVSISIIHNRMGTATQLRETCKVGFKWWKWTIGSIEVDSYGRVHVTWPLKAVGPLKRSPFKFRAAAKSLSIFSVSFRQNGRPQT